MSEAMFRGELESVGFPGGAPKYRTPKREVLGAYPRRLRGSCLHFLLLLLPLSSSALGRFLLLLPLSSSALGRSGAAPWPARRGWARMLPRSSLPVAWPCPSRMSARAPATPYLDCNSCTWLQVHVCC
jgi:hypothetical protein